MVPAPSLQKWREHHRCSQCLKQITANFFEEHVRTEKKCLEVGRVREREEQKRTEVAAERQAAVASGLDWNNWTVQRNTANFRAKFTDAEWAERQAGYKATFRAKFTDAEWAEYEAASWAARTARFRAKFIAK
jgi:hypothetical protein